MDGGSGFQMEFWTAERGLPDSSVMALAQTPDGYLWVGTYNGLARFDGIKFKVFDPENTPALGHARIRMLFVDQQGALWINTFDGSLARLKNGTFTREWTATNASDRNVLLVATASNSIVFVMERGDYFRKSLADTGNPAWEPIALPNRNVLPTPLGNGDNVIRFNGASKRMWRLTGNEYQLMPEVASLGGQKIHCVESDNQGGFWVGTDQELARWQGTNFINLTPTNGEPKLNVALILPGNDGGVWTVANGRVRKAVGARWVCEADSLRGVFGGPGLQLSAHADRRGGLWLFDDRNGLAHVGSDGAVWRFDNESHASRRLICLLEDREGSIWAGFQLGGLVRIRESRFQTLPGNRRSANTARSVCEDRDGSVWIGTLGDGLVRWQASQFTNFSVPGDSPNGSVSSICTDADGRLWLSAGKEDLYVGTAGKFELVTPVVHGVKTILAGRDGRIWAGTRSGLYVAQDGTNPVFKLFAGLDQSTVRAIVEDTSGAIWGGNDEGTIFRIATNDLETMRPQDDAFRYAVWSLLVEGDGTVWAGTYRGGLLRFKDGQFFRFSKAQGLPDNIINQILADEEGHLWLGTHKGIVRVAKSELASVAQGEAGKAACILFGRADGLPSVECSGGYQPAACRSRDGRLWFTTLTGVISVQPQEVRPNPLSPPVVIEEFLAGGKPAVGWQQTARDASVLELPPGKRQVEFHYVGLSLISAEQVRYRYQLVGEDPDWVDAGDRRVAHYGSLGPGRYSFKVTAGNADGIWNPQPAEIQFVVLPHYYETAWFHGAMLAGGIGACWWLVRRRYKLKLKRQSEEMERRAAVEQERARIAKDIHDDLGASLTLIAVMGDLARGDKDDGQLRKISDTARQAVRTLDEIVWAVNPRNDRLANLVDYIGGYAADYLNVAQIRCRLDIPDALPGCELTSKVRYHTFLAVKEALQNIVKHSRANEVCLHVEVSEATLKVCIGDNGSGFAAAPDDMLADGLRNMHQRMDAVGGSCLIDSRVGAGTKISFEVPVRPGRNEVK